jgi:L-alanine-DL-glutamate epimerase-like enolase superfamily enzyme
LRADVLTVGGISVGAEIAEKAHAKDSRLSLHISPEIHEHCAMAWDACDHVEIIPQDRPFDRAHDLLVRTTLDRVSGGYVQPSTAAGSDVRLDDAAVKRFSYRHGRVGLGGAQVLVSRPIGARDKGGDDE